MIEHTEAASCPKCEVCKDSSHHWEFEANEEWPCGYYTCKHCGATGVECLDCDGYGYGIEDEVPCTTCNGEGVIPARLARSWAEGIESEVAEEAERGELHHVPTHMEVQLSLAHLRVAEEVFRKEPISRLPTLAGTLAIAASHLESMMEVSRAKDADILRKVQTELKTWQERNFPGRPVWMPVMGIAEESGEACHACLKREQGIRRNEDHTARLHDALADVIIYACDAANAEGIDLSDTLDRTWAAVRQRDWVKHRAAAKAAEREKRSNE